ncbi:MAG: GrpB family protein [Myxococcales bacterium]|nr:GrpB family protein [Myxococcales bacterium]MCB9749122.1 GrpB family protein [Myxococcales bacterium]
MSDLGLDKRVVRLAAHNPSWAALYERERPQIVAALAGLARGVEHVGSTSVPGLAAKPVLDIAARVVAETSNEELIARLSEIGYLFCGDKGADGGVLFVRERAPLVRTHHLHVVRVGEPTWALYLGFRAALRADAGVRRDYERLKRSLVERFAEDRAGYTAAKAAFIRGVLAGADPDARG